jgi:hypothetical protein
MKERRMNRRDVMKLAVTQSALVALPAAMASAGAQATNTSPAITLRNSQFELVLRPGTGLQCRLVDRRNDTVMADGSYFYSFGAPVFTDVRQEGTNVSLRGRTDYGLHISHRFTVDAAAPWIEEEIALSNVSSVPIDLHDVRTGFVLPIAFAGDRAQGPWARSGFTAIPFRRAPSGHEREIRFDVNAFGLSRDKSYQTSGATFSRNADEYVGLVRIPARGHVLVEIN